MRIIEAVGGNFNSIDVSFLSQAGSNNQVPLMEIAVAYVDILETTIVSTAVPGSVVRSVAYDTNVSIMSTSLGINWEKTNVGIWTMYYNLQGDSKVTIRPLGGMSPITTMLELYAMAWLHSPSIMFFWVLSVILIKLES